MKRSRITNPVPILAALLAGLLFTTFGFSLDTPARPVSHAERRGFARPYDVAHEVKLTGNVQKLVTKHVAGSPAGMHLLIDGPQGTVDAHLGPYLGKDVQAALHEGTAIEVVGAMATLHGKQVLLARQLIFGGRIVTVRSPHGFLVRAHSPRAASANSEKTASTESN